MATAASVDSNHGLIVTDSNVLYQVNFAVTATNLVMWSVNIDGVWEGEWHRVGNIDRTVMHRYTIQMESDATFAVLVDGIVKASGIVAGPPTVWANGVTYGVLRTQAPASGKVLNTVFDNVVAR
jgi:hypothetical protein